MIPQLVLAGRPNVGKSTLFNKLIGARHALVADVPGLTRDRQYGRATLAGKPCMTLPWPDFYRLCGRVRMKQPFLDELRELASARFQLILAYGRNAVVVCHDRNFADIAREPWWKHDGG